MLGGATQYRHELVIAERLLDVIKGAFIYRLHCRLERCLGRHQDDRTIGITLLRGGEDVDAGDVRHPDIGEHDIRCYRRQLLEATLAALREPWREPFSAQQDVERIPNSGFVVHDEDGRSTVR